MSEETTRIIEVNGVKLEIDLRTAKRVDQLRVGDRVKVLEKTYGDNFKVHPGTLVGFEPFEKLPTIIICYLDADYSKAELKFLYYNAKSQDIEVIPALDSDQLAIEKENVLARMDREIEVAKQKVEEIKEKRSYFVNNFKMYWPEVSNA